MKTGSETKAWVVSADMGYGHLRAVHPFASIAEEGIIRVGENESASKAEKKLWSRVVRTYELFSRSRGIPVFGKPLFFMLDSFLRIPSFYPIRNLSRPTFQSNLLESSIKQGLCRGEIQKVETKHLPLLTSFYAPAIAADRSGYDRVYCIICDADLNRVWVANEPSESRVHYFAPCGKAAARLKAYGVPQERISTSGFPLSPELLGEELCVLKRDLGRRLVQLDPSNRFFPLHQRNVEYFLGAENLVRTDERPLTITYAVGGAGAQKEIGGKVARALKEKIRNGEVRVYLVAGIKPEVREYFLEVQDELGITSGNLQVVYEETLAGYFSRFDLLMRETDILWTKPSELSFFCGLGIPIVMTPPIGSQEKFNRAWLLELQAGIRQENPEYADQWLFDYLHKGRLAEAAWAGFLKARKLGYHKILEYLHTGMITQDTSPLKR
jgi:hypothetical protein